VTNGSLAARDPLPPTWRDPIHAMRRMSDERIGAGKEVHTWLGEKRVADRGILRTPAMPFKARDRTTQRKMERCVKGRGHAFNTDGQTAQQMSELGKGVTWTMYSMRRGYLPWGRDAREIKN